MFTRIAVVALNTYREAVRARILHGLFGLALVTAGYCMVVGEFALRSSMRVVSDLGAASVSFYGIVVAVVLGATSLYRELELKTLFPILARPIRRSEYLVGKYLGSLLTLAVFVTANAGILLLSIGALSGASGRWIAAGTLGPLALAALAFVRAPRARTYLPIALAAALAVVGYAVAAGAVDDRQVVVASSCLTLAEVAVIMAIANVFSSFSSPFLTATFTFGVFIVGRSADTLARLPEHVFGAAIHRAGVVLSKVMPNLMLYVPPRPLLTGEASAVPLGEYLGLALVHALAWSVGLMAVASIVFKRRDFL